VAEPKAVAQAVQCPTRVSFAAVVCTGNVWQCASIVSYLSEEDIALDGAEPEL